jgi:hypothetical protein
VLRRRTLEGFRGVIVTTHLVAAALEGFLGVIVTTHAGHVVIVTTHRWGGDRVLRCEWGSQCRVIASGPYVMFMLTHGWGG